MKSNKKLLVRGKRVLAWLLAVTMVTGTLPTSVVHAAELPVVGAEEVSVLPDGDVTAGDATAEDAKTVNTVDPADGGVDEDIKELYADAAQARQFTFTFDTAEFEKYYSAVYPYGSYDIYNWNNYYDEYVRVIEDGIDRGTLEEYDNGDNPNFKCHIKWQVKNKEGAWEDVTNPTNPTSSSKAGSYQLLISVDAVENWCAAVSNVKLYDFEIAKAEVQPVVRFNYGNPIQAGTSRENVKTQITSVSWLMNGSNNSSVFNWNSDESNTDVKLDVKVKNAYTGVDAPTQLLTTDDYVVEITPSFTTKIAEDDQANYSLQPVTQKLNMAGIIETNMTLTMKDKWIVDGDEKHYSVPYTGNPIAAPMPGIDYELKVLDPANEDKDISSALEYEYKWCDEYGNDLGLEAGETPVNAGTYTYRITHKGVKGLYALNSKDMTVEVTPKKLILKPVWKTAPTVPVFYPGMTARDVMAQVDYEVRDEAGNTVTIDRDHFWGDASNRDETIPYQPAFKLQVEEIAEGGDANAEKTYHDVAYDLDNYRGVSLTNDRPYRVIFTGQKYIYYGDGDTGYRCSINTNGTDSNYEVVVNDDAVLTANVLQVQVNPGKVATIDVSKIPAPTGAGTQAAQAGTTYANPYKKVYDLKGLYDNRGEYKLAEVKGADGTALASGVDQKITYRWYELYGEGTKTGADGKEEKYPIWNTTPINSDQYIPSYAGTYRLLVTYADPTNEYHAPSAEVIYVIEPQKIKVVPTNNPQPTALTGTSVYAFDDSQMTYEIRTVVSEGESTVIDWWVEGEDEDYTIDWVVEQRGADGTSWIDANDNFDKTNTYRVKPILNLRYYSLYHNYTDVEYVTVGTGDDAVTTPRSLNETMGITLNDMGTNELKITVDATKLTNKVYDGLEYGAELAAGIDITIGEDVHKLPAGAFTITKADGSAAAGVVPELRWKSTDSDGNINVNDKTNKKDFWPIDAGRYTLYISFRGDTTYKAVDEQEVGTFEIKKKKLTVTPNLAKDIPVVAGDVLAVNKYLFGYTFEGVVERDAAAFEASAPHWKYAAGNFGIYVKDEDGNYPSVYKTGKTYKAYASVGLYGGSKSGSYARNYDPEGLFVPFMPVRGNSTVTSASTSVISSIAITDKVDGMSHTITPEQGIDYVNDFYYNDKRLPGNYVAFKIALPKEYRDDYSNAKKEAFYKNQIEEVGYVVDETSSSITVAFDASKKDQKKFSIRWEEGYIEEFTVDFTNAVLGEDLRNAVDPKSIAFNSPNKKMAVGEVQALDVKITKKLQSDIICLQYSVVNPFDKDVLCVNKDTGLVTALDDGKASVIVTPVKEDENGKLIPVPNAKPAKVDITVSDVTAPKIQKVTALDYSATVTYGQVSDGFRREVYVLEKKNASVTDFEEKIAAMTNQHWEGLFAVEPAYYDYDEWTVPEWWNKAATYKITGLKAETEYTVYVRNVSRARTLPDGCKVTVSGKGTIKGFKTTKTHVKSLNVNIAYGENTPVKYLRDEWEYYDDDDDVLREGYYYYYEVPLKTGSVKVDAFGRFVELPKNDYADNVDRLYRALPLKDAAEKKLYVAPKLVYQVAELDSYWTVGCYASGKVYNSQTGRYDNYYFNPTTYASIDKSGKLKLNGVDRVYVRVVDSTTNVKSSWIEVRMTATPDSIVPAKNSDFQVGESRSLISLVDYKEGNLVLRGRELNKSIICTEELRKKVEASGNFVMSEDGTSITAVGTGSPLTMQFKDIYCGAETSVTVKTKALAAATGLKASFVTDKEVEMCFNYNGYANKFKVEVTDGRGRLIESVVYNKSGFSNYTTRYELGYDLSKYDDDLYYYTDAKGKNYYYFNVSNLTKLSSYNVTVTAIYQNSNSTITVSSKAVKKAVKTTNMPASYWYLQKVGLEDAYGGINITYRGTTKSSAYNLYDGDAPFISGNTYTLYSASANYNSDAFWYARYMLSDTLTWTSTNKKVATIKTNAGTYTASLKALRAGSTTIELKSKITKKVIARYRVYVNPVGKASSYYGENERQDLVNLPLRGTYSMDKKAEASTAAYSFTEAISGSDAGTAYVFTAPADATYTFWTTGDSNTCGTLRNEDNEVLAYSDGAGDGMNFKLSYKLAAGEKVSLDVREWTFGDFAATLNISTEAAE